MLSRSAALADDLPCRPAGGGGELAALNRQHHAIIAQYEGGEVRVGVGLGRDEVAELLAPRPELAPSHPRRAQPATPT